MTAYIYPSEAELREVEQALLPKLTMDDPIFSILPIQNVEDTLLMWEIEGNYTGLQQARGMGGRPSLVSQTSLSRYSARPGVYGEFIVLDEEDLLRRRMYGTFAQHASIDDLVMRAQRKLLTRRLSRISYIGWTLITTGTFSVAAPHGAVVHSDTFSTQTYSAGVAWSTAATATPLADFRAMKLKQRGYSVRFDRTATAYMNQVTFNYMTANLNAADLYGKRTSGLAVPIGLNEINAVLLAEDLPQIQIWDEGYYLNDSGTFVPWLADSKVAVVGRRTSGAPIGSYRMTLNINNNPPVGAPGAYTRVVIDEDDIPLTVAVHDGHNGGPVLEQPNAIIIASV